MSTETVPSPLRVALQNVGCKLNAYEVEALSNGFGRSGYRVVPFNEKADVYVVNTCTVTGSGDSDSRKAVRRARRTNPTATIVATGCYAQRRPDELSTAGADLVVGNGQKADLLAHVQTHLQGQAPVEFTTQHPPSTSEFLSIEGQVEKGRTRGMLQVQDGCDEHCTYCIIPSVRGQSISRPAREIVAQAQQMVATGYRELALTGVHTGSYGYDKDDRDGLVHLLEDLEQVDGLERIRLNSVEPAYITDALIRFAAHSSKFCHHFHVPLQSGDDQILKRMGRHYDRSYYRRRIEEIAAVLPDCAIGADVMVGFPGEEEAHFENTYQLLEELPMTYLHVFPFSLRDGTAAEKLNGHSSSSSKKERSKRLIDLGLQKRLKFHQRFLNRSLHALVEDRVDSATGLQIGMSGNYIKVLFSGGVAANEIVKVQVQQAREDLVFGELI
ncbi:MAG: threonylcarbamoyladenosine tRNA methylthiotransferase MtaB [Candidatus Latescibacterota bacterium]|jgi:threonylcarbamoyladenosine tRNA methylthiotransferase MtaB